MATAFSSDPRASTTAAIRPQTHQREVFRRAELQRDARERRRRERDQQRGDATGEEGAERGDAQRRSGAALTRHLVAIDGGDNRGCLAGDVDQDGRGRAAVLGPIVDAGEHDQRRLRLQRERDRQQHGNRGDRTYPGQYADHGAEQDTDEAVRGVLQCQGDGKSQPQIRNYVHRALQARPDVEWKTECINKNAYGKDDERGGQCERLPQTKPPAG